MIRTPLFGKDSLPHHTSGVLGLIGTVILWLLLLLAGILIPAGKNKPKLKPVQIVLSPPEKTFQKTPQDSNLKKDSEGALSSMQNEADMQQSEPQFLENAADASEMPVVEMTEPVAPPVSEPVIENTAQNVPVPKAPEPVVEKTEEPTVFSVPFINEKQVEIPQEPVKKIPVDVVPTDVDLLKSSYTEPTKIDICPNCGTRINPNDKICMICGHPLQ